MLGLRTRKLKIDIIISSPIKRARSTAAIVKIIAGVKHRIHIEPDIADFGYGPLSGMPIGMNDKDFFSTPGIEDPEKFKNRIISAIKKWPKVYPKKNILFVSHNGVARMISCTELNLDSKQYRQQKTLVNATARRIKIAKL